MAIHLVACAKRSPKQPSKVVLSSLNSNIIRFIFSHAPTHAFHNEIQENQGNARVYILRYLFRESVVSKFPLRFRNCTDLKQKKKGGGA